MPMTDLANYTPRRATGPACRPGEFVFGAIGLDHDHINGMCQGLSDAGAQLAKVYDPDPARVNALLARFPEAVAATSEEEILEDPRIQLVACAAVPADRAAAGLKAMEHGKDFFVDKPPLTTLAQLAQAKQVAERTGRKYGVYYSERIHVEAAVFAGQLVEQGAIGRVFHVLGTGPHRLSAPSRPSWFFEKERYGGILCDIGSHQVEQFLYFTGATDAEITSSRVANYNHKQFPGLEDFGDCNLVADNGAAGYFRVDWFTPDGLGTWGDGRMFLIGTEGYIELRKYVDVARDPAPGHVYLVDGKAERRFDIHGQVGFPFFGQFIRDCLDRTDTAMPQQHAFKAAELCVKAEAAATRLE